MAAKTRLNMDHGFMHSIIRNQVDRDNYDKEVKAAQAKKTSCNVTGPNSKHRKPVQGTYRPPSLRPPQAVEAAGDSDQVNTSPLLFVFEYEDEHGSVRRHNISETDRADQVSHEIAEEYSMSSAMTHALKDFLSKEMERRLKKPNS